MNRNELRVRGLGIFYGVGRRRGFQNAKILFGAFHSYSLGTEKEESNEEKQINRGNYLERGVIAGSLSDFGGVIAAGASGL